MSKTNQYYRKRLSLLIGRNGGYHRNRDERVPLSYSVPLSLSLDEDSIRDVLRADGYFLSEADSALRLPDFMRELVELYPDEDSQAGLELGATERLRDDLKEDEGLRMWSPATAASVGFDYKGDGADRPFSCTFTMRGRSGKHVCVDEFDGFELKGYTSEGFIEVLDACSEPGGNAGGSGFANVSNQWVRALIGMIREWDMAFTSANASQIAMFYIVDEVRQRMGEYD